MKHRLLSVLAGVVASVFLTGCETDKVKSPEKPDTAWLKDWATDNRIYRGVHFIVQNDRDINQLIEATGGLAAAGVNVIVLEVNYNYDFVIHPEMRPDMFISKERARAVVADAHAHGIRVIPQLNCLGHQSWAKVNAQLLTKYPQFDETPGQFPENKDIYCRSWCPQNPEVNKVVFALIDELADAFLADAFHVGMDEVFLIASEHCSRCRGGDPAKLFAKAVNDLYGHIVGKRKLDMLIWGDRLLDAQAMGYSEWEAARNGTQGAIDLIPKDIIICDWHYGKQQVYHSVPFFMEKGFRVWPAGWQPLDAAKAFSAYSRTQRSPQLVGYLCTTWGKVSILQTPEWPPILQILRDWQ